MSKRCCFAGHSKIYNADELYEKLKNAIEKLIVEENVLDFWVGNYGSFDRLSAEAVGSLKSKYPEIQLNLVIPYLTSEIAENKEWYYKNYDNILMAEIPERTPEKFRILKCNEYMVKSSDFLVCFVNVSFGGAAKTLEYAKGKNIKVFNII